MDPAKLWGRKGQARPAVASGSEESLQVTRTPFELAFDLTQLPVSHAGLCLSIPLLWDAIGRTQVQTPSAEQQRAFSKPRESTPSGVNSSLPLPLCPSPGFPTCYLYLCPNGSSRCPLSFNLFLAKWCLEFTRESCLC